MPAAITRKLSEADMGACAFIIDFIYERCRIRLHSGKEALITARLGKRIRHHGFSGLAEYCAFLRSGADEDELTKVVDALTTNFTSFLREEDHFKFLVQTALPPASKEKRFRVWSAACSSGEEPYTLAFYLMEHFPLTAGWDWKITATDISTKVLEQAKSGVYAEDRVRMVPQDWIRKYFQRGIGHWLGHYRVKPMISDCIEFRQLNLIADYQMTCTYDVIFCRNVMIYFDRPTQEMLVNQLCRHLSPRGFLMIGHSESLTGLKVPLNCLRPSIYQKTN